MKFSANLGFLWTDRALPQAVLAAHAAGFDAVECHWPYDLPATELAGVLAGTGLPLLALNTLRGDVAAGEFGLSALPGRAPEARAAIDQAFAYAAVAGARHVHVLAGRANGDAAHATFCANLRHACARGRDLGIGVLIEPLNPIDAPGYFLRDTDQAAALITEIAAPNLKLMFDCYHVQRSQGDVTTRLRRLWPLIGHIQFAGAPGRGRPDRGELNLTHVFQTIADLGWRAPLGAEYRPGGRTEDSLGWLAAAHAIRPAPATASPRQTPSG